MLINGEKWACEACVRGHRVSNCQHSDRPLQHINKKGRPVSQCQHCRQARKSRAAHTKCDCGEKMFKCQHLKTTVEGHTGSCCCNHGGRCTCINKKDQPQLETVPEHKDHVGPSRTLKGGIRARRRATAPTDSMLSFDENGMRRGSVTKPAKVVAQLNRVNSMFTMSSTAPSSSESPCCNSPVSTAESAPERRMVRSEAASPLMTGTSGKAGLNAQLPPLDIAATEYDAWPKFDMFTDEPPMFSAGLSASVDWSHYDGLDFGARAAGDFAPSNYSQPQSYGGFELNGSDQPPTMTTNTSTSGEPSELDDLIPSSFDDLDVGVASHGFSSLSGLPDSFLGTGLDYEFKVAKADPDNQYLPTPASLTNEEPILAAAASASMPGFSAFPDEMSLWLGNDFASIHGLPTPGLPMSYTDSPDGTMPSFWDAQ